MSNGPPMKTATGEAIGSVEPTCMLELAFLTGVVEAQEVPWGAPPGTVATTARGGIALHYAPGRWLLLDFDSTPEGARQVAIAVDGGAQLFDVQGKWRLFKLADALAMRSLRSTVDVAGILEARECAATEVFDVPAIIAWRPQANEYWLSVPASFATSVAEALNGTLILATPLHREAEGARPIGENA